MLENILSLTGLVTPLQDLERWYHTVIGYYLDLTTINTSWTDMALNHGRKSRVFRSYNKGNPTIGVPHLQTGLYTPLILVIKWYIYIPQETEELCRLSVLHVGMLAWSVESRSSISAEKTTWFFTSCKNQLSYITYITMKPHSVCSSICSTHIPILLPRFLPLLFPHMWKIHENMTWSKFH